MEDNTVVPGMIVAIQTFDSHEERLGIDGFREKVIGSPFDYKKQALLYIDRDLPSPDKEKNESFQQESLKTIEGLVNASRGRALILLLRQGIGRLIRSTDDRGVVAILDSRLVTSSYGRAVIASLPEMEMVHTLDAVRRFFGGE